MLRVDPDVAYNQSGTVELLPVQRFAPEGAGSFPDITGHVSSLRLQLEAELAVIGDLSSEKVITHKVKRNFLIPRSVDANQFGMCFVAVKQQLNFPGTVPGVIKGGGCVADITPVDFDERALRIRIHGHAPMHTAGRQQTQRKKCHQDQTLAHQSRLPAHTMAF